MTIIRWRAANAAANASSNVSLTVSRPQQRLALVQTHTQTAQTINFGNFLKGAAAPASQSFTVYNRAANTSAFYTSNLKLTGFSSGGDAALSTTLSPFGGLAAGGFVTYTAALNTANYSTTGLKTVTMPGAQLLDDNTFSGAGSNNNGTLTVTLVGTVGSATADASGSPMSFGAALSAQVASGGSYANLESTVKSTSGSGGSPAVGSTATILAGSNASGSNQTVNMQWRTRSSGAEAAFASDIVDVSGMSFDGSGQASPFVLQMTYDAFRFGDAANEGLAAASGQIGLDWYDPGTPCGRTRLTGNFVKSGHLPFGAGPAGDMTLGDWGVNTANDTVWAIVNHNSEFAVVPEPGTLILLTVIAVLMTHVMRRRSSLQTA